MTITRTALARFLISQPPGRRPQLIKQSAAWLVASGQTRRSKELVLEVARLQAEQGRLWVSLTTARPLSAKLTQTIEKYLKTATKAKELEIESKVRPEMIGGILVETADQRLDAPIAARLRRFVQAAAHE